MAQTDLLLVRHGQTAWNQEERFRGRMDLPLTEPGKRRAHALAAHIASHYQPAAIYSSPLRRAVETAEPIAASLRLAVQPSEGLLDIDFGDLTGLSLQEAQRAFPEIYQAWMETPHTVRFPSGESLIDVRARGAAYVCEICQQHPNQQVVLVTHSVMLRVLFCYLLGLHESAFWQFHVDTCSLSVFRVSANRTTLMQANYTVRPDP